MSGAAVDLVAGGGGLRLGAGSLVETSASLFTPVCLDQWQRESQTLKLSELVELERGCDFSQLVPNPAWTLPGPCLDPAA